MKNGEFLPFALPDIGEEEVDEVCDTLRSGWLTTGPKTKAFESDFSEFVAAKHALAVNSATSGLHLALEAIGVGPGDKVLSTVNTFTASAEVIRYLGADPLFVDITADTLNMDVDKVEELLDQHSDIAAIMPVHIAGQSCDMDRIVQLALSRGIRLVEDAAHALPTSYKGQPIGAMSDAAVFSFYVTKTLATGEGGMVVTNDDEIASRIRTMRLHGINRDVFDRYNSRKPSWYYEVVAPGFKYNMPDIAAAIGIHQLRKLTKMRDRRQQIADAYFTAFGNLPVKLPEPQISTDQHSWHLFVVQLDLDALTISRNEFVERMAAEGIGTSVHFIPLHLQPYWRDRYQLTREMFPVATAVYERIVSLPIYSKMTDSDIDRVINAVRNIVGLHRR
jgi:dTDP-4-amino-4,6-dideoxygalactose transaminase